MTPHNALIAARELVKANLEKQDITRWGNGPTETGKQAGEYVVAMLKEITTYFEQAA